MSVTFDSLTTSQTVADVRAALVLALACAVTALATYLVPASVHVVGWDGDLVLMVSLLPPVSRFGLFLGVAIAVALVLGVVDHRRPETATARTRRRAASILVSPAGASAIFVTIQNRAEPGPVTVVLAGAQAVVILDDSTTRRF